MNVFSIYICIIYNIYIGFGGNRFHHRKCFRTFSGWGVSNWAFWELLPPCLWFLVTKRFRHYFGSRLKNRDAHFRCVQKGDCFGVRKGAGGDCRSAKKESMVSRDALEAFLWNLKWQFPSMETTCDLGNPVTPVLWDFICGSVSPFN